MRGILPVALGAAMLMWTALANGRPAVFTDTALYYNQAEYLFEALGWVSPAQAVAPPHDPTTLPVRPGEPNISAAIDRARSPAYGAPVYLLQRLGGLWLVAAAQALAVAGVLRLLYRAAAPKAPRWGYLALMAGLAALTPLPFFAAWIMPDVFAGVMGCALLLLLVYPDRLDRAGRAAAVIAAAYSLAVHRSNLMDAAGVAILAAGLLRLAGAPWRRIGVRLASVAGAAAAALAANAVLEQPIQSRAGEPIGSPPFLSARVLADGPGRSYLRRACRGPSTPFELCGFQTRPMVSSDQVLWSMRRRTAVFLAADPAGRLRMEREDARFALDVLLADPWGETRAAAGNAMQQLVQANVDDPLKGQSFYVTDHYWRHTVLPRILPDASACTRRCPARVGMDWSDGLELLGLSMAVMALACRLSGADVWARLLRLRPAGGQEEPDELTRLLTALALVAGLLVVNAAVCGALSGPFPRYQARLIWLAPMMAALVLAGAGPRVRLRIATPFHKLKRHPRTA